MSMVCLEDVERALALSHFDSTQARQSMSPVPRGLRTMDGAPRQAAVLALLYLRSGGDLAIVLTRRRDDLRAHSGQISFPGGKRDPRDASFQETALRETQEELGVPPQAVRLLGQLSETYIPPTHYNVHPFVGYADRLPPLRPNEAEVAEVLHLSLDVLLDPRTRQAETRLVRGFPVHVPYYLLEQAGQVHKIWGATAIMLSELEARLRAVQS
ncbi:MAG: CoA pyrophosphatase [Anaerolineae bacterium]|nr:CoA pyrophosphatase [Anaerolineae bacterium]MDW8171216.1 CoA pyrophosphatase [Anaerolineae bacterium]